MTPSNPRTNSTTLARVTLPFWLLCLLVAHVNAQDELPTDRLLRSLQPTADVNDFAGVLTPDQRASLEERCRTVRQTTGAQLAAVVLKSLEGGQVDDFAVRLFKQWAIGQKDEQNGVLLLVAIEDRQARIEVGYGLEPILPDALAGRILNEELFPAFKQQRYFDGLNAAIKRIAQIIEKNEPAAANVVQPDVQFGTFPVVLMLSLFVAVGSFILGAGLAQRGGCLIPQSLLFIALPFLIGWSIAFPWAPLVHLPLSLFMGWLGWQTRRNQFGRQRPRSRGGWLGSAPGWDTWDWSNSMGGSGWSGGGFSGGGGSDWGGFGGGSSGGGGASGGW
jgi:uncharacterized protein